MRAEALSHEEEDKKKREFAEAGNTADQAIYAAEKALKEHGDKVGEDIKKGIQEKIDALRAVRSSSDVGALKSATDALGASMSVIYEAMQKTQGGEQKPPEGQPPESAGA